MATPLQGAGLNTRLALTSTIPIVKQIDTTKMIAAPSRSGRRRGKEHAYYQANSFTYRQRENNRLGYK